MSKYSYEEKYGADGLLLHNGTYTGNFKQNVIEYMHREIAYTKTKAGEIIPFSLAKEIRNF